MSGSKQMTTRRPPWAAYGAVVIVALAVRFLYWGEVRGTPLDAWQAWDQTDMATYVEQGKRIAAGDWLAREPFHPYHLWQSASGTEADWLRWYRPHAFHQAPLYSYAYALASRLTNHPEIVLKALQLVAGAGTALVLALVARALAGDVAGIMTGLICALYGPLYYLECQLLREGPAMLGIAALLWLVVRQVQRGSWRWWQEAAIGAFVGLFAMFHEFALLLAFVTVAVLAFHAGQQSIKRAMLAVIAFSAGYLTGFSPLLARNFAVGAAPLSISSRPHLTLALANMPESPMHGIVFGAPGTQFKTILDASGGTTLGVLRELWRAYDGRHAEFFSNWLARLAAIASGGEIPDNTSFEFHRDHVAIMAACLTFRTIFPLGAAGIVATLFAIVASRARNTSLVIDGQVRAQRAAHLAVLAYLPAIILAVSLVNVQARYRMIIVPFLMIYSGVFVADLFRLASNRHVPTAALLCATALTFAIYQRWRSTALEPLCHRPVDSTVVAISYSRQRNEKAALPYYEEAFRLNEADGSARARYAGCLARIGRLDQALEEFRRADAIDPGNPEVRQSIAYLQRVIQARSSTTAATSDGQGS